MATMSRATTFAASANALLSPIATSARSRGAHLNSAFLDRTFKLRKGVSVVRETRGKEAKAMDGFLSMLGFGARAAREFDPADVAIAAGPDEDRPADGHKWACFGAGCFWGVELAYQRVPGVTKTEVGYTQGQMHQPTYEAVCSGQTGHSEVVRVEYNPAEVNYENLLNVFWDRHDPTTLNRQGGDVGTQYRSGIYVYSPEQEKTAKESLENRQKSLNRKIVTEILPAKKFYRAESYHQQYLAKGGRMGLRQSAQKGCNDPIRCYG